MAKVLILCHADADGICSGAIALSRWPKAEIFFTKPVSLLADLKEVSAERIIIADIAITARDGPQIVELLSQKARHTAITYIDHHPLPPDIKKADIAKHVEFIHQEGPATSELIYTHYQKDIPKERIWPAIYGSISDYAEDTIFMREIMRNWEKRALYFEVSTLVLGIKMEEFASYDAKREIVKLLAKGGNPSDVYGLVTAAKAAVGLEFELYQDVKKAAKISGLVGYVKDIHTFGFRGASALFAATVTNAPIGICVHTGKAWLDITIRSRDPSIDINRLAQQAAKVVAGSGGGLPNAGGARIPMDSFDRFIAKMNELLKNSKIEKLKKFDHL
jgi:RecJ-like exonuclease